MLDELLKRHRLPGALLDTNLLVMYLIGCYRPSLVEQFKRTSMYTQEDFYWLHEYVAKFSRIVVTPQVLAEAWNFLEKIRESEFRLFLVTALDVLYVAHEDYTHKDRLFSFDGFSYIGVTDSSVIHAAKRIGCLVLTDDLRAFSFFSANDVAAININHLRPI